MNVPLATLWAPQLTDLRPFAPELVLVATIAAVLLLPVLIGRQSLIAPLLTLLGVLGALVATSAAAGTVVFGSTGGLAPAGQPAMLITDKFGVFFRMLLLMLLVLITWLWMIGATRPGGGATHSGGGHPAARLAGGTEFFVLLLTSALGMLLMVSSLNLLVILVAIETASLPSYAIVASDRRSRPGAEAALKYVMFGAASAAIMVYGMSLLYGRFGTLDLGVMAAEIAARGFTGDALTWLGLAALAVGVLFKIAAVPMHLWCPDVFEGAPVEVTTWLSIASKAAGLGLLLRIVSAFVIGPAAAAGSALGPMLGWSIGLVAAVTCTVGNLAALRQESVKRILAYSSIAHAGYMMMAGAALAVAPRTALAEEAFAALVAYLFVYLAMNVGAFGATALVAWQTGSDHLLAFTGLMRRAPWVAVPLAVCLFSLVGLPPLGGFAAKWYLLVALGHGASAGAAWLWVLVVVAVINTALSLYYYVRIIRQMALVDDAALPPLRAPAGGLAIVNACAVALLLLGTVGFWRLGRNAELLGRDVYQPPRQPLAQSQLPPGNVAADPRVGRRLP